MVERLQSASLISIVEKPEAPCVIGDLRLLRDLAWRPPYGS